MNKVITAALVAGGLMLLNVPEATAHTEVRNSYQSPHYRYYGYVDVRRSKHMPRWLKRNESFRRWYRHTSLRRNQRIAWGDLFDVYRWEHRHGYRYDKRHRNNRRHDGRRRECHHRH